MNNITVHRRSFIYVTSLPLTSYKTLFSFSLDRQKTEVYLTKLFIRK